LKKLSDSNLATPVYLKLSQDMPWPEDDFFYLLSRDGFFLCRNHAFFQSSTPTEYGPSELAGHKRFIKLSYPKLPQRLMEKVVGFFSRVADRYCAEAAVLLAWNSETESIEVIVPEQRSIVGGSWSGGKFYPINVYYDVPNLPPNLKLIGDIHSHVDGPAYASHTDIEDEAHFPGLHIVVGRIYKEPPEIHIEVTVDGNRFTVENHDMVLEGYKKRRVKEVPEEWMDKVVVETKTWKSTGADAQNYYSSSGYYGDQSEVEEFPRYSN